MNKEELEKIKQKALQEHIPIIMDETLEVIEKYLPEPRNFMFLGVDLAKGEEKNVRTNLYI